MLRIPRILTMTSGGPLGLRMLVASVRAGALGVFDPVCATGVWGSDARAAAERAGELLGRRRFGVRLGPDDLTGGLVERLPEGAAVVVARGGRGLDWASASRRIEGSGRTAVAEVASREAARDAVAAGFGALIVDGQEAGGWVGDDTSFVLLQAVLGVAGDRARVWVRGGIGPGAAAACMAAGAAGVVLDGALLLARESPLSGSARRVVREWDGSETVVLGAPRGPRFRAFVPKGVPSPPVPAEGSDLPRHIGWGEGAAWPVGQDAALAAGLADAHATVGGIVQAVERAIDESLGLARSHAVLGEGSALAAELGTRFPIVQGPMTRVSDRPEFAVAVAEAGALPVLALAMARGPEARALIDRAAELLGDRPWGVGLLGFLDPSHRREQIEAVLRARPRLAIMAGGRPDQAVELDAAGVATYLHVPSPRLLARFVREGARRFVLEGRECGGHVGPRTSLMLWEQAGAVLAQALESGVEPSALQVLYAGGVHDARSAAAVAAMAAPLAARGARVGVLMGTAYLFTREAVGTGAIVEGFQHEALNCTATALLETGPGHQVRVSVTPYLERFEAERRRLQGEGRPAEEVRLALEALNVGRLRIAAKGLERTGEGATALSSVDRETQRAQGLYMLGDVATLRHGLTTIAALHEEVSTGPKAWLRSRADAPRRASRRRRPRPSDVAIVGMSAIVPGAADAQRFWENTLGGLDAITEVPSDRWDWRPYYDADPKAPDRIISRWGGFVPEVPFDPLAYGMPPTSLSSIEPLHLLTLEAVRAALADAGYLDRPFPRERTSVVLGAGGGAAQLAMGYALRSYLPLLDTVSPGLGTEALALAGSHLPEWTEDSFPGILLNVAAGRVANRFDLGGANYTVDAACGSSLAAAALAVRELESRAADVVVLGGADTVQNPFTYLAFSKTQAFSPRGRCRPFDTSADGIVISEGVAVVVLKRLADAERDGDRIYAVIKGLGASSDGRAKGLTAPRPEGQVRALNRAYEKAGVSPAEVGYVEAHGTGTAAGDVAEVGALTQVFRDAGAAPGQCGLGSVKSLIGHTKCAAGLAGLVNAARALYHRVYPPTIGVETPNPRVDFPSSPFHLSRKARPWLRPDPARPRRAGVSAFGFGGTNFHAVLEAYEGDPAPPSPPRLEWPAELFAWRAVDRTRLADDLKRLERALAGPVVPPLRSIADALAAGFQEACRAGVKGVSLAIVASTPGELRDRIGRVETALREGMSTLRDPSGIELADCPTAAPRVAFLFPGQGSQYPGMLEELTIAFPLMVDTLDEVDRALSRAGRPAVGPRVHPPLAWHDGEAARQKAELAATEVAQPALGAVDAGVLRLLESLGLRADLLGGHSYGELVALHAAGVFSLEALAVLSEARGRLLASAAGDVPGAMAALAASAEAIGPILGAVDAPGVVAANQNGPSQTVISGPRAEVERVVEAARARQVRAQLLPVSGAFHSPLIAAARSPLAELVSRLGPAAPRVPVFSNLDASPYADDPGSIAARIGDHAASPVRFAAMVEAMHAAGATVFVEVGPGNALTSLAGSILAGREHLAVSVDPPGRRGIAGLLTALARLVAAGVALDLRPLTAGRAVEPAAWGASGFERLGPAVPASAWWVDGNRARPASGAEVRPFGSGPALPAPEGPRARPTRADATGLPVMPASPPSGADDPVFAAFQKSMRTFLDVQRATMLQRLAAGPRIETAIPAPAPPEPPARAADPPAPPEVRHDARVHDETDIERRLLEIVQARTGYPAEMLRPELDLEADLGIDSIKRVEILGTLRESIAWRVGGSESELMDQLSRARTLGAIVGRLAESRLGVDAPRRSNGVVRPASTSASQPVPVRRMLVEVAAAPDESGRSARLAARGVVLVTDDGRGVAAGLAQELARRGLRPVRLEHAERGEPGGNGAIDHHRLDLADRQAVGRLGEAVRRLGPVAAVVHAAPLHVRPAAGLDSREWDRRMRADALGLFTLAREFADDLERSSGRGGAALLAATALGGRFASGDEGIPDGGFPGHGALAGLVKTLAREWSGVRTRVVDFHPEDDPDRIVACLLDELDSADIRTEIGYDSTGRVELVVVEQALDEVIGAGFELSPGEPVVVTGGARGITGAVAADLARRWRPTLLLVGTSPHPGAFEPADTAGVDDPATLKARLLARLRRAGRDPSPVELERAYQSLRREREIRSNLERLRAAGSAVEYAQADVRDESALRVVLDAWRQRHGDPVGLIHGAGVIHDKLLRDKSADSIDRVIGTKLKGALNLARALDDRPPRFTAFFSSVAGRFGNRGQSDYAAANEALNKLAVWLDARWPGRVVSLNWGPWSGVGMVSELESHLGRRGLGMIDPTEGVGRLADELRLGRKGEVEVVIAGDLGNLVTPVEAKVGR